MITVGHTHTLEVVKIVDFGVYLDAKNLGEVLLPFKYEPDGLVLGDRVVVFIYFDSDDRLIATTKVPKAQVDQFAFLKVNAVNRVGAFLDWGLAKDVLVPFGEQHKPMEVGRSYLVYLFVNRADGRIVASSKIDRFVDVEPHQYVEKQAVDLIIANSTDLGFKAIINHRHWGVLYKDEVFQRLSFGQYKKGFIKKIRADGKVDLSLDGGEVTRNKHTKIIENYLIKQNGFASVHDKSEPELISELFGMSKSAFKKAIGGMFKKGIINIEENGIRLLQLPQTPQTPREESINQQIWSRPPSDQRTASPTSKRNEIARKTKE